MANSSPPSDLAQNVKVAIPVPDDSASLRSETARDFIQSQLQLEADAREVLPYSFSHCTQPLGPLKQNLFSCLTCNPPESSTFQPAAVCYSCSIACHGEHTLVELFHRRNFTCDCGTTRMPDDCPCTLRIDPGTGLKGPVKSEKAAEGNTYNHNCKNRFCGCGEVYDAHQEKGTMFQCLGLTQEKEGGCGEDWWHPECVVGLGRDWFAKASSDHEATKKESPDGDAAGVEVPIGAEENPLPPGFPQEEDFDNFICYKCVDANPRIKQYAGTTGFLPAVYHRSSTTLNGNPASASSSSVSKDDCPTEDATSTTTKSSTAQPSSPKKRSADDAELDDTASSVSKTPRVADSNAVNASTALENLAYHASLPPAPSGQISLFMKEDFRDHFCRCKECYPSLSKHPQLLEEEESYEPPLSEGSDVGGETSGGGSQRSLLDRGEAALSNVDRVRAIEGVMVYNHLKDKVKSFLQPFAESGQPVGAEDIKAYFEKLRGDEQGIAAAAGDAAAGGGRSGPGEGDTRREQGGY